MINSLKDVKEINGKKVITDEERPTPFSGEVDWESFDSMRDEFPICIDHEKDMISFKMMTKSVSEGGDLRNAQFTELVGAGLQILKYLNAKLPCRENAITITKLEEALMWQEKRTQDRIKRNVEGKNQE